MFTNQQTTAVSAGLIGYSKAHQKDDASHIRKNAHLKKMKRRSSSGGTYHAPYWPQWKISTAVLINMCMW